MATIKLFEDIDSWKKARDGRKKPGEYIDNDKFKKSYRLINQIDGSSGSIWIILPRDLTRGTRAEFIPFLGYAKGSCGELRSQLYRSFDRKYINEDEFNSLKIIVLQISGLLQNLIAYLQKSTIPGVRKKTVAKEP